MATNPVKVYEYLSAGNRWWPWTCRKPRNSADCVLPGAATRRSSTRCPPRAGRSRSDGEAGACAGAPRVRAESRPGRTGRGRWTMRSPTCPRRVVSVVVLAFNNLELTGACSGQHRSRATGPTSRSSSSTTPPATALASSCANGARRERSPRDPQRRQPRFRRRQQHRPSPPRPANTWSCSTATPGSRQTGSVPWSTTSGATRASGIIGPVTNNIGNEARSTSATRTWAGCGRPLPHAYAAPRRGVAADPDGGVLLRGDAAFHLREGRAAGPGVRRRFLRGRRLLPPGGSRRVGRGVRGGRVRAPPSFRQLRQAQGGVAQQLFRAQQGVVRGEVGRMDPHALPRAPAMAGTAGRAPSTHPWTTGTHETRHLPLPHLQEQRHDVRPHPRAELRRQARPLRRSRSLHRPEGTRQGHREEQGRRRVLPRTRSACRCRPRWSSTCFRWCSSGAAVAHPFDLPLQAVPRTTARSPATTRRAWTSTNGAAPAWRTRSRSCRCPTRRPGCAGAQAGEVSLSRRHRDGSEYDLQQALRNLRLWSNCSPGPSISPGTSRFGAVLRPLRDRIRGGRTDPQNVTGSDLDKTVDERLAQVREALSPETARQARGGEPAGPRGPRRGRRDAAGGGGDDAAPRSALEHDPADDGVVDVVAQQERHPRLQPGTDELEPRPMPVADHLLAARIADHAEP